MPLGSQEKAHFKQYVEQHNGLTADQIAEKHNQEYPEAKPWTSGTVNRVREANLSLRVRRHGPKPTKSP